MGYLLVLVGVGLLLWHFPWLWLIPLILFGFFLLGISDDSKAT